MHLINRWFYNLIETENRNNPHISGTVVEKFAYRLLTTLDEMTIFASGVGFVFLFYMNWQSKSHNTENCLRRTLNTTKTDKHKKKSHRIMLRIYTNLQHNRIQWSFWSNTKPLLLRTVAPVNRKENAYRCRSPAAETRGKNKWIKQKIKRSHECVYFFSFALRIQHRKTPHMCLVKEWDKDTKKENIFMAEHFSQIIIINTINNKHSVWK